MTEVKVIKGKGRSLAREGGLVRVTECVWTVVKKK